MRNVRRQLPKDSLEALSALVRILASPSSSRGLFGEGSRARTVRRLKLKKHGARRSRPSRPS
jgi:hypothetical protein